VRYPVGEEKLRYQEAPAVPRLLDFAQVGADAYRRALPLVGRLAAGGPFHGFDIDQLQAEAESCAWIAVPEKLAGKNRFAVRVAGDSMAPTLPLGSLAVFEYHRSPREDGQIVIANLNEFGPGQAGTEAIKRLRSTPQTWRFESDNPKYPAFEVSREEHPYPILGVFVGVV
jgi:SOS-response transcriptional repressor LexA